MKREGLQYAVAERDEKHMASFTRYADSSKWDEAPLKLVCIWGAMAMTHPHDNIRVGDHFARICHKSELHFRPFCYQKSTGKQRLAGEDTNGGM